MIKSLKNWWGRFLFRDSGILPTKRLLVSYLVLSVLLIIGSRIGATSWEVVFGANIVVIGISFLDLFLSPSKKEISIKRVINNEIERGIPYTINLSITNTSSKKAYFQLKDGLPATFKSTFPLVGEVDKQSTAKSSYTFEALVRGKYNIEKLYFRYTGVLGLWEKQKTFSLEQIVKVIPDLTETKQYLESAQKFLLHEGSKIRKHQQGVGEFAKIRNYVVGDDPRKINWRQTAKLQEVMTNEYEPEHGKYITVLIDCGRMMGAELSKVNRLEKSLESAITLCAAALQNGDYVSVLAFGKEVKVYVRAAKGMAHLQEIIHALYNIDVEASESNYTSVFQYLQTMQKKRSFILLFSDIHTFLYEERGLQYLKRLRRRHVFYMIGIEDELLQKRVKERSVNVQAAMLKSVAQEQYLFKQEEKMKWEKQGLHLVEAPEEKLAVTAVSYYIDIMNRGLI
ncbi:DUF58 domain-containing protein [Aquibacillus kalidii]|uniref:DUF58 domain-containing protein n=1 Tax=Aquibacillus kalidii TaxID=2762597 RepID=UPI001645D304|nr:DUF58 domain-containing protein [Aquibacillus kalidii]